MKVNFMKSLLGIKKMSSSVVVERCTYFLSALEDYRAKQKAAHLIKLRNQTRHTWYFKKYVVEVSIEEANDIWDKRMAWLRGFNYDTNYNYMFAGESIKSNCKSILRIAEYQTVDDVFYVSDATINILTEMQYLLKNIINNDSDAN